MILLVFVCVYLCIGSMACSRSPPPSPRAPKIQQQSWDDCGTPPIDLFDPNHQQQQPTPPPSSSSRIQHRRDSHKSRNIHSSSQQDDSPKSLRYNNIKWGFVIIDVRARMHACTRSKLFLYRFQAS